MGYKNNQFSKIVLQVDNMKQYGKDFSLEICNALNEFRDSGKIVTTIESEKNRLTVKGNFDPREVRERLEKITNKNIEFISPTNSPEKKEAGGGATAIQPVKPKQENQLSRIIIMADDMKCCEVCALMIENSFDGLRGVDEAKYDRANNILKVLGKVEPWEVEQHVDKITYNNTEADGGVQNKAATVEPEPKQLVVSSVVLLKVHLDCDGCVRTAKNTLLKVKGVEVVTVDVENDLVIVKGTMDVNSLPWCLKEKLGRSVEIFPESVESVQAKSAPAAAAAAAVAAAASAAAAADAAAAAAATATPAAATAAAAAADSATAAAAAAAASAAAATAAPATAIAAAADAAAAADVAAAYAAIAIAAVADAAAAATGGKKNRGPAVEPVKRGPAVAQKVYLKKRFRMIQVVDVEEEQIFELINKMG